MMANARRKGRPHVLRLAFIPTAHPAHRPIPAPSVPAPDSAAVLALASGVQQLCTLCEDLLALVVERDDPMAQVRALPEQIDAVRVCAEDIKYREILRAPAPDESYSLAGLSQWVWRE